MLNSVREKTCAVAGSREARRVDAIRAAFVDSEEVMPASELVLLDVVVAVMVVEGVMLLLLLLL